MENKNFDFQSLSKDFFRPAKNIEFEMFDFKPSTEYEIKTLPHAKKYSELYTAVFFCRDKNNCFFYKVIYDVYNKFILNDKKSLFKRLEIGARTKFQVKSKTKNPFKYLSEINIYPIEGSLED